MFDEIRGLEGHERLQSQPRVRFTSEDLVAAASSAGTRASAGMEDASRRELWPTSSWCPPTLSGRLAADPTSWSTPPVPAMSGGGGRWPKRGRERRASTGCDRTPVGDPWPDWMMIREQHPHHRHRRARHVRRHRCGRPGHPGGAAVVVNEERIAGSDPRTLPRPPIGRLTSVGGR